MKIPSINQQYKHILGDIVTIICVTNYYDTKDNPMTIVFKCEYGVVHSRGFCDFKNVYRLIK